MSIGPNQNYNKINVTIPKTTTFVHKAYINVSREIWKNPYLFNENVLGHEYQRNMKQVEDIIKLTIEDTIRRQLPIKEILREHLESENEKATTAPVDLKMLMKELQKANKVTTKEKDEDTDIIDEVEEAEEPSDNIDDIVIEQTIMIDCNCCLYTALNKLAELACDECDPQYKKNFIKAYAIHINKMLTKKYSFI